MGQALTFSFLSIASLDLFALNFDLFFNFFWLDAAFHFFGGIWAAGIFFWFFNRQRLQTSNFAFQAVLALSFVALIGVLWEFAEFYFLDSLLADVFNKDYIQQSLADTINDLFFDLAGGLAFAVIIYEFYYKRR